MRKLYFKNGYIGFSSYVSKWKNSNGFSIRLYHFIVVKNGKILKNERIELLNGYSALRTVSDFSKVYGME